MNGITVKNGREVIPGEWLEAMAELQAYFCTLIGYPLMVKNWGTFWMRHPWYENSWIEWLKAGHLDNGMDRAKWELYQVVRYLNSQIRIGKRNKEAIKLTNMLVPVRFDEDLMLATSKIFTPDYKLARPVAPVAAPAPERATEPPAPDTQADPERQRLLAEQIAAMRNAVNRS